MILAIRTDRPTSELYLLTGETKQIAKHDWQADRQLADTILPTIEDFLGIQKLTFRDLTGIIIFTGQGSFTGLRIGTTVANTLAFSLDIPIVKSSGEAWLEDGVTKLKTAKSQQFVTPEYDGQPNITRPKSD